jgi:putative glutamine amidotransferase
MSHPSSKPLIGLTTYAQRARFGWQDTFSAVLPMAYVRAVHAGGGRPVLVAPHEPDPGVLEALDGVVLTGGADVEPSRYGAAAHPRTYPDPARDAAELSLLHAALDAGLPVLGVCRGMQLMAVAAGGRLHQHLPDLLGHDQHRPADPPPLGEHVVEVRPGSLAHTILGDSLTVNSLHHQGVADPGRLIPTGWCPADDLVEVVEDPAHEFVLGVQWHPEESTDRRLFAALVEAARERRSRRLGPPGRRPHCRDILD